MSVRMKIIIPVSIIIFVAMAAILVVNIVQFSNSINEETLNALDVAGISLNDNVDGLVDTAYVASMYLAADPVIIDAIESGSRENLLFRASQLNEITGLDICMFVDPEGKVIARTHDPGNYGDDLSYMQTVSAALAGRPSSAVDQAALVKIGAFGASPVYSSQGILLGVALAGFRMDTDAFVDSIKKVFNVEVTVFQGDMRIATTVVQNNGARAVGTQAASNVSQVVLAGQKYRGEAKILDTDAYVEYIPIIGAEGKVIGMLFVGRYTSHIVEVRNSFIMLGAIIFIAALVIGGALIIYITGRVVAPLRPLTAFMRKAGTTGDIILSKEDAEVIGKYSQIKDEIGQTITASVAFLKHVTTISEELDVIANGDLAADVVLLSEQDVLGISLHKMTDNLNTMFREISSSVNQVSTGSKQVADGSQSLAQGATQQAASIEELSNSISEIANKTKSNADMAMEAASLADTIKGNAEKGSRQMGDMMVAVNEINSASQSISKVIKTIDDIAFQTNILALNAAVEAARAGQHGKGFAVVAEEVRNLAAKSAQAAKETGSLIENSMEKANSGVQIAGETAESLTDIVSGINESSRLVSEIARSSEEQSLGIDQINTGIDQVTQVVQQNSATAEESAAASEEMSGQSDLLKGLISQFKLKGEDGAPHSLPSGGTTGHRSRSTSGSGNTSHTDWDSGGFVKY